MKNLKSSNKYHKGISIFLTRYAPKKYKSGFTLIELLVVISIISLLSSVVLASVSGVRERAVLTKTVSEMRSLQQAVELYRNKYGLYPSDNQSANYVSLQNTNVDATGGVFLETYSPNPIVGEGGSIDEFYDTFLKKDKFMAAAIKAPNDPNNCNSFGSCHSNTSSYTILDIYQNRIKPISDVVKV